MIDRALKLGEKCKAWATWIDGVGLCYYLRVEGMGWYCRQPRDSEVRHMVAGEGTWLKIPPLQNMSEGTVPIDVFNLYALIEDFEKNTNLKVDVD